MLGGAVGAGTSDSHVQEADKQAAIVVAARQQQGEKEENVTERFE